MSFGVKWSEAETETLQEVIETFTGQTEWFGTAVALYQQHAEASGLPNRSPSTIVLKIRQLGKLSRKWSQPEVAALTEMVFKYSKLDLFSRYKEKCAVEGWPIRTTAAINAKLSVLGLNQEDPEHTFNLTQLGRLFDISKARICRWRKLEPPLKVREVSYPKSYTGKTQTLTNRRWVREFLFTDRTEHKLHLLYGVDIETVSWFFDDNPTVIEVFNHLASDRTQGEVRRIEYVKNNINDYTDQPDTDFKISDIALLLSVDRNRVKRWTQLPKGKLKSKTVPAKSGRSNRTFTAIKKKDLRQFFYRSRNNHRLHLLHDVDEVGLKWLFNDNAAIVAFAMEDHSKQHKTKAQAIYQYTDNDELIAVYKSQREAARKSGMSHKTITRYLDSRDSVKGYKWATEEMKDVKAN